MSFPYIQALEHILTRNKFLYDQYKIPGFSGLVESGARLYHPASGRFMGYDVLYARRADINHYLINYNNPILMLDINGQQGVFLYPDEDNANMLTVETCFIIGIKMLSYLKNIRDEHERDWGEHVVHCMAGVAVAQACREIYQENASLCTFKLSASVFLQGPDVVYTQELNACMQSKGCTEWSP